MASPLANILALDALALASLALAESLQATAALLSEEPMGRVAGLVLVGFAWFTVRVAPRVSIGARRVVAVAAAVITLCVGVLHGSGPEVVATFELRVGVTAPWRELGASLVVSLASARVWATSPAVRG